MRATAGWWLTTLLLATSPGCLLLREVPDAETETETDPDPDDETDTANDTDGLKDSDPTDSDPSETGAPDTDDTDAGGPVAPVVQHMTLLPASPLNDATLTCSASASDPDGGAVTVTYAWTNDTRGGAPLGTGTTLQLEAAIAQPGDRITCRATVEDDEQQSASDTRTATVGNRAPTVASATLTPSPTAQRHETVTCDVTAADPDGETPTVTLTWTNDTTHVTLGTTSPLALTPATVAVGDVVTCDVLVEDASGATDAWSASTTAVNSAPEVGAVGITPDPAYNDSALTCTASPSDPDGDPTSATYTWSIAGGATLAGPSPVDTVGLSGGQEPGTTLRCTVEVGDGSGLTDVGQADVTLADRPPTGLLPPTVTPALPAPGDSLTCVPRGGVTDPDGQPVTTGLRWFHPPDPDPVHEDESTVPAAAILPDETWICETWAAAGGVEITASAQRTIDPGLALTVAQPCVAGAVQTFPIVGEAVCVPGGWAGLGCVLGRDAPTATPLCDGAEAAGLSSNYWMTVEEITEGVWAQGTTTLSPSEGRGPCLTDDCPVTEVSWFDAMAFARDVSNALAGLGEPVAGCDRGQDPYTCGGWRLPTQAEWEHAARGDARVGPFAGPDPLDQLAWFADTSGGVRHPVCTKTPNGLGLCDMTGNVVEWLWDGQVLADDGPWIDPYVPPQPSGTGQALRVGGGFQSTPETSFVFQPAPATMTQTGPMSGFRLVWRPTP